MKHRLNENESIHDGYAYVASSILGSITGLVIALLYIVIDHEPFSLGKVLALTGTGALFVPLMRWLKIRIFRSGE